jgi:signal transduction histidine kinase/ActR/RegA family two-component response regulator
MTTQKFGPKRTKPQFELAIVLYSRNSALAARKVMSEGVIFKRLRTKLTVLYVAMFAAALAMLSLAVDAATTHNVQRMVRDQLLVTETVFQKLSSTRTTRSLQDAKIMAHDFGFRAAVATGDEATVRSALSNLAARSGAGQAFVVTADGRVIGRTDRESRLLPPAVVQAIEAERKEWGVFVMDGTPYEGVVAAIRTPATAGWLVFANPLGPKAMENLRQLSAIPLQATVVRRVGQGAWSDLNAAPGHRLSPELQARLSQALASANADSSELPGATRGALTVIRPLNALDDGEQIALLLRCPLAEALQPYSALLATIFLIGGFTIILVVLGSWLLAQTVTRPISALENAAKALQRGENARVEVNTHDEIAALGRSFNAMADDIDERTTNLKQAREAAEAANHAKSVFLANMNHEVRTPLNGVVGVASMLAATPLDAGQRQMVEMIEASGQALHRILNDVLDMVDLGSEGLTLVDRPFDLGALTTNLAAAEAARADAKGLDFRFTIAPDADGWVQGDSARVEQVLANLLNNAVKFTEKGGVDVSVSRDGRDGMVRFVVRDTGVGFDQAFIEQLFSPFSQADGSMTRRTGGTGLGLSLSRDLARAMKGDVTGAGEVGRGAEFVLTLPLPAIDAPWTATPATADAPAVSIDQSRPATRVLVADDHAANRKVIEMILDAADVDLVLVENGAEAVEAYKAQPFDVVLMDLQMPVMDGLSAIKLIREHEAASAAPRTPILVISANVQAAHLRASAAAGADGHLAKPIMAPVLIAALEQTLSGAPIDAAA